MRRHLQWKQAGVTIALVAAATFVGGTAAAPAGAQSVPAATPAAPRPVAAETPPLASSVAVATTGAARPAAAGKDIMMCNDWRNGQQSIPAHSFLFPTRGLGVVTVKIDMCVGRKGKPVAGKPNPRIAWADTIRWTAATTPGNKPEHKRFNRFVLEVRLEHNEVVKARVKCDLTAAMNKYTKTTYLSENIRCLPKKWLDTAERYKWTADGTVAYDFAGDGAGTSYWQLQGTPEIS